MAMGQEELGRLIRQAREDADMTQSQLAAAIGLIHPQSISNYERGVTEVPAKKLRRIAEATKKPLAFFLGETPLTNGERSDDLRAELAALRSQQEDLYRLVLERLPDQAAGRSPEEPS